MPDCLQAPSVQVKPELQGLQAAPPVPHFKSVGGALQTVPSQQPLGQFDAEQDAGITQVPVMHCSVAPHTAQLPPSLPQLVFWLPA